MGGFLRSFAFAARGIAFAARGRNFRVQLGFALVAVALSALLGLDAGEWALIAVCIASVLGGECMNTALESLTDLASPRFHELAARAKDCAAGAVLCASIGSLIVGLILFVPKIAALVA